MGAIWSQQSSLKLSAEQGLIEKSKLKLNTNYKFRKPGHRLYTLDTPIELFTDKWQAIARVSISQITVGNNITSGIYKVLKIYSQEETDIISQTLIPYKEHRKSIKNSD